MQSLRIDLYDLLSEYKDVVWRCMWAVFYITQTEKIIGSDFYTAFCPDTAAR